MLVSCDYCQFARTTSDGFTIDTTSTMTHVMNDSIRSQPLTSRRHCCIRDDVIGSKTWVVSSRRLHRRSTLVPTWRNCLRRRLKVVRNPQLQKQRSSDRTDARPVPSDAVCKPTRPIKSCSGRMKNLSYCGFVST